MRALAPALFFSIAVNAAFLAMLPPKGRPASLHFEPETAVETAGLLSLGMRRLTADIGLIRMLVYYGSDEPGQEEREHEALKGGFNREHPELYFGGGHYPQLYARAKRILELDPSFSYAVLYGAGALAFNLSRPQEAIDLLSEALARQPNNTQFRSYLAAVGFSQHGETQRVLSLLEPTLADPDCPTMIKNMVAFLYKRSGQRDKAVRLYRDIAETSRDRGYRETALRVLAELGASP